MSISSSQLSLSFKYKESNLFNKSFLFSLIYSPSNPSLVTLKYPYILLAWYIKVLNCINVFWYSLVLSFILFSFLFYFTPTIYNNLSISIISFSYSTYMGSKGFEPIFRKLQFLPKHLSCNSKELSFITLGTVYAVSLYRISLL